MYNSTLSHDDAIQELQEIASRNDGYFELGIFGYGGDIKYRVKAGYYPSFNYRECCVDSLEKAVDFVRDNIEKWSVNGVNDMTAA